jgi:uncharacterized membrane protein
MQLVGLILISAVFYSMFVIFAGLSGGKINQWLASVMFNGIGTFIPLVIYSATSKGKTTSRGIIYALLAGVSIMIFSVLLSRIFNKGGNLSFVIPALYGTAIVLSGSFGWLFLKEKMSGLQVLGFVLVIIGVGCIVAAKLKTA